MPPLIEFKTKRLRLRQWQDADLVEFSRLNSDPEVMKYYPAILSAERSRDMARNFRDKISRNGWGFWAVERLQDGRFIGFVGLNAPDYDLPVTPCIEIGWRLGKEYWGRGYATEAAKACLDIAFCTLDLAEVYAFTSALNKRSQALMERIGMHNTFANFEHPMLPDGHALREHVLYKVEKGSWDCGAALRD